MMFAVDVESVAVHLYENLLAEEVVKEVLEKWLVFENGGGGGMEVRLVEGAGGWEKCARRLCEEKRFVDGVERWTRGVFEGLFLACKRISFAYPLYDIL